MVRSLWLLLCYQYWILEGTPLGYPVVILCHGDLAVSILEDQPLHVLQQFIDKMVVGVGQIKDPNLDLGGR